MIPSFKPGIMSSNRIRAAGGGADVTPDAVNWANLEYNGYIGEFGYSERQISGIDTTITLKVEIPDFTDVYVLVESAAQFGGGDAFSIQDASYLGFTQLFDGDTFTVSNNQWVTFMAGGACTSTTITVKNQSDGNATLDTFLYDGYNC